MAARSKVPSDLIILYYFYVTSVIITYLCTLFIFLLYIYFVCRCVVLSFDDGEIKIISLLKAASDVPVTGMPCDKKPLHGSYSYYCSSSSIWSVQVSSLTGNFLYT
ncbi:hypothetical protein HanOQP8_Chr01g0035281 [Helianthus annuus]|nr:hypothetical protein HanOQP8_Chr01g0035281 [Helianthus annuus]